MTTLKEAIAKGKLDEFIKEHDKDAPGDAERLDKTISAMVNKQKTDEGKKDS